LVFAVVLLGAWELYAELAPLDAFLLPAPSAVASALADDRGLLWSNFTVTAGEVLLGIALGLAAALVLAGAIHASTVLRRALYPLLIASQTIPIPIVAPLLVVWLGYDIAPKLAIVALVCVFPVVVATGDALAAVEPELLKLMRTLGATRWQTFLRVEAPSALPALFSGARIAVSISVIAAVFAEYAGSSSGLGHLIQQSIPQLETARAYAAVVLLSAFALALFGAVTLAERRLAPWGRA
jgi:ABC-type nitrate/sulfonate/bicarbonate transport system permease component